MNIYKQHILFMTVLLTLNLNALDNHSNPWTTISKDLGVKTQQRNIEGTNRLEFRGEIETEVDIAKILTIFFDRRYREHWVDMFEEQNDVKLISLLDKIYRIHLNLPWPIKDRDYLIKVDGFKDDENHTLKVKTYSIDPSEIKTKDKAAINSAKKNDCCIRAEVIDVTYIFKYNPNNKKTHITVTANTDPKGSLPSLLLNYFQKNWCKKTLSRLLEAAKNIDITKIKTNPIYKTFSPWTKDQ